jgi:deazaflavin-dependent oxidoreductase (nitroreductase family)
VARVSFDSALGEEDYCYLTTTGRVTGRPHTIEIWFGLEGDTLYMLSGGGRSSDWVKNLSRSPAVEVRIADQTRSGRARVVEEPGEDEHARLLLFEKYRARYSGDLSRWRTTALPIAVDLGFSSDMD